jgi:hypothetical protein
VLIVLKSIDILILVGMGTVFIVEKFLDFGLRTEMGEVIKVAIQFPKSKEVQGIDCLFVLQEKINIILKEERIARMLQALNSIFVKLSYKIL